MRYVMLISTLLMTMSLHAQRLATAKQYGGPESDHGLEIRAFGGFASPDLTNAFLSEFLSGETLTRSSTLDQLDKLDSVGNRFGGDYATTIRAFSTLPNGLKVGIVLSDEIHVDSRFTRDLMDVALTGNASYAGQTAHLGPSNAQFMRFQKFGIETTLHDGPDGSLRATLSYVNGQRVFDLGVQRADFYTSKIGDTVTLDARSNLYLSDSTGLDFLAANGAGGAIDLAAAMNFESVGGDWTVSAFIRNFGIVQWKPNGDYYEVDTIGSFTGVEVNDLENIATGNNTTLEDTLLGDYVTQRSAFVKNSVLPGWVQIELSRRVDEGLLIGLGVNQRWNANYRTFGWIEAGYKFPFGLATTALIGYGGYGSFQSGVTLNYSIYGVDVFITQQNLEALIAPKHFAGYHSAFGLRYSFGA